MVGVRADHPLADRDGVRLADLDGETLGIHSEQLFPAWSVALRQVLQDAGVSPRTVELADTDLSACRWPMQAEVDWILTTRGVSGADATTPLIPASPAQFGNGSNRTRLNSQRVVNRGIATIRRLSC